MEKMFFLLFLINNVAIIPYKRPFFFFPPNILGIPCPEAVMGWHKVMERGCMTPQINALLPCRYHQAGTPQTPTPLTCLASPCVQE